eukprot:scaffold12973_cov117-Isochrysis_galbana.AAC.8
MARPTTRLYHKGRGGNLGRVLDRVHVQSVNCWDPCSTRGRDYRAAANAEVKSEALAMGARRLMATVTHRGEGAGAGADGGCCDGGHDMRQDITGCQRA